MMVSWFDTEIEEVRRILLDLPYDDVFLQGVTNKVQLHRAIRWFEFMYEYGEDVDPS